MNKFGIDVQKLTLKSGLKTIIINTPGYNIKGAAMVAPIGGCLHPYTIDGKEVPTGIAHFLEHRLFDTKKGDGLKLFASLGMESNAYTSFDHTAFHFYCSKNFEKGLKILFDMTTNLTFKEDKVENEKPIIIQELKRGLDNPKRVSNRTIYEALYVNNPVNTAIIGSEEDVSNTTLQDLKNVFESFYNVETLTLIIAGDFKKNIVSKLNRIKINRTVHHHDVKCLLKEEPFSINKEYINKLMDVPIPLIKLGVKLPLGKIKEDLKLNYAQLSALLNMTEAVLFADSSPFMKELSKADLRTSGVYGGFDFNKNYCTMMVHTMNNKVETFVNVCKHFIKHIDEYISKKDFSRQKKCTLASIITSLNLPSEICLDYVTHYVHGADYFDWIEEISKVNYNDMKKLLKYIMDANIAVSVISKESVKLWA